MYTHASVAVRATARTGRLVLNLALVAVVLFSAAFVVASLLGFQRYVITGGSMSGSIERGSVVFSRLVPVEDLRLGDVITYLPPSSSGVDNLVTHRIVAVDTQDEGFREFRTKGDANASADPWTFRLFDNQQTRVAFSVPYVGYVFIALADRETRMVAIGVPAALVALSSLYELVRALRSRRSGRHRADEPSEVARMPEGTPSPPRHLQSSRPQLAPEPAGA